MPLTTSFKLLFKRFIHKYFLSILVTFFFAWIAWNVCGLDSFFYKRIFGVYTGESYPIWQEPKIEDIEDPAPNAIYNINGYRIKKRLRKRFALSAVSVYRDDNTTFWRWWFENSGDEIGRTYNDIAVFDLSLVHGIMAQSDILKKYKFTHEQNVLFAKCVNNSDCSYKLDNYNNFHVIPASRNIRYGLKSIPEKRQVRVYVEGYLMDWESVEVPLKLETALYPGQIGKQKVGGRMSGFCFQLYLTKLVFDGYVFK